jgi:hypothetical protein
LQELFRIQNFRFGKWPNVGIVKILKTKIAIKLLMEFNFLVFISSRLFQLYFLENVRPNVGKFGKWPHTERLFRKYEHFNFGNCPTNHVCYQTDTVYNKMTWTDKEWLKTHFQVLNSPGVFLCKTKIRDTYLFRMRASFIIMDIIIFKSVLSSRLWIINTFCVIFLITYII